MARRVKGFGAERERERDVEEKTVRSEIKKIKNSEKEVKVTVRGNDTGQRATPMNRRAKYQLLFEFFIRALLRANLISTQVAFKDIKDVWLLYSLPL